VSAVRGSRIDTTFTHRMSSLEPIRMKYGQVRILDSSNFPATTTPPLVEVEPSGMRKLHWHPNADEWQYHLSGQSRMTVFASGGPAETFRLPGERRRLHPAGNAPLYREHRHDETMRFLEMFKSPKFEDVHSGWRLRPTNLCGAPENRRVGPRENPAARNARGRSLSQIIYTFRQGAMSASGHQPSRGGRFRVSALPCMWTSPANSSTFAMGR
jgi:oxalate decarboxylase/phosphoglucose isomerase-like protein (cupin superfamily)